MGGEKRFNDRISWALTLPLALLALWAADLLVMVLEIATEGDVPGSARAWALPLMSLCGGYAGVYVGAKVAPDHKPQAAAVLAALYLGATIMSGALRLEGFGRGWLILFVLSGALGVGAAVWRARNWPAEAESKP